MNGRPWTPYDVGMLHYFVDEGYSYMRIARKLKRSRSSVAARLKRHRLGHKQHDDLRSASQVAAVFGVTVNMLCGWIARGWLPARNAGNRKKPFWRIGALDILAFLDNDETWIAWVPAQLTDPDLRAYAAELRAGPPRWMSTSEIAHRFHVDVSTVQNWIRYGLLSASMYGSYFVRAEHVAAFVPPFEQASQPARCRHCDRSFGSLVAARSHEGKMHKDAP